MSYEQPPRRLADDQLRSPVAGIIIKTAGGIALVATSFWLCLQLFDSWFLPPNASEIRVLEATYGFNCRDFKPPSGQPNKVGKGNLTAAISEACKAGKGSCSIVVDGGPIGDPAPGCRKDFMLRWHCGDLAKLHQTYVPEEAQGKTATMACP
jgi:hypothetical protein